MILKISGINFKLEVENFFEEFVSSVKNEKYHIVLRNLNFFELPDKAMRFCEIDEILIYSDDTNFYFVSDQKLILNINHANDVWVVEINQTISKNAIKEIILKKVIPLFCYTTHIALPLHATAIIKENKLLCFSGYSTIGKSTLAASMICNKGYHLVSDDVLNLFQYENKIYTFKSYSHLKLRKDSYKYINYGKLSNYNKNLNNPIEIKEIILLCKTDQNVIKIEKVTDNLNERLLQNLFAAKLCDFSVGFLKMFSNIRNNLEFWELTYPRNYEVLPNVENVIIRQFEEKK